MPSKRILVVGDVMTDLHLNVDFLDEPFVQLGGIFHAARTLNSIGIDYALAYFSPQYLDGSITEFAKKLDAKECLKLGQVEGAPNVMVIMESTEAGDQGYIELLRDQSKVQVVNELKTILDSFKPSDVLIFPGKFCLTKVLNQLKNKDIKIHIDLQYIEDLKTVTESSLKIETAIFSSSSSFFQKKCNNSINDLIQIANANVCSRILFKENRGGSRLYEHDKKRWFCSPSFPVDAVHSVGVGDCFNSVLIALEENDQDIEVYLRRASYIASLYASTWSYDIFTDLAKHSLGISNQDIISMKGISVPWERRKDIHIYIAAPDFPDVDTRILDKIEENLKYHNFQPHLPVRENGLITGTECDEEQNKAFIKDIELLEKCDILVAVLLYDDPGTLVELGYFAKAKKPTILFDVYRTAKNMFLRKIPNKICYDLKQLTDQVFEIANAINRR